MQKRTQNAKDDKCECSPFSHLSHPAYMQNRLTNSQRYLVNAKPGTNHRTNPINPNGNSKR